MLIKLKANNPYWMTDLLNNVGINLDLTTEILMRTAGENTTLIAIAITIITNRKSIVNILANGSFNSIINGTGTKAVTNQFFKIAVMLSAIIITKVKLTFKLPYVP